MMTSFMMEAIKKAVENQKMVKVVIKKGVEVETIMKMMRAKAEPK